MEEGRKGGRGKVRVDGGGEEGRRWGKQQVLRLKASTTLSSSHCLATIFNLTLLS